MIQITEKIRLVVVAALVIVLIASCDPTKKYEKEQKEAIQNYLNEHPELDFELKESGLYYFDVLVGSGMAAAIHDTAYVMYKGTFLDGSKLDENYEKKDTLKFPIGEGYTILGFDEGITYMNEGGKAMFLMPSELAFGNYGSFLPAYTPVVFEAELAKIVPSGAK